jgi:hypothetical protein
MIILSNLIARYTIDIPTKLIDLLEQYSNKINWFSLSDNPAAIYILEKKFR